MSTLLFLDMTMTNFMSTGNITQAVKLNNSPMTLIMGNNVDDGGKNGAGKTVILNALSYVLYNETITDIKMDNLINNINKKNMLVTVNFKKNGVQYRIERGRKPNVLKFFVDGSEKNEAKGENKTTQDDINEVIGMTHTMFTHLVCMNTYTEPFLKMKPTPQRELIEELLGVSLLSQRDETVKKLISESKRSIDVEQAVIKSKIDANSRIEMAIQRAANDSLVWENSKNLRLINLKANLEKLDVIDFDKELKIIEEIIFLENKIKKINQDVSNNNWKIQSKTSELNRLKSSQNQTPVSNVDKHIERLTTDLKNQEIILSKNIDNHITMLKKSIETFEDEIQTYNKSIDVLVEEIAHFQSHLESDEHFCNACGQKFIDIDHLKSAKEKITKTIEEKTLMVQKYLSKIENLEEGIAIKERDIVSSEDNHKNNLELATKRILEIENEIQIVLDEKENEQKLFEQNKLKTLENIQNIQKEIDELIVINNEIYEQISMIKIPKSDYKNKEELWSLREQKDKLLNDIETEYNKENPHQQNILNLESTLQEISYDYLNNLKDDLLHEEFIHKLLSGKDSFIRKKIIDQNLYYLNTRVNYYLNLLGLPHEIKFLSDLTVEITHMGNDYDFPQISRGQQGRVILATAWAFRDVWENLNHSVSLMFVDELCDNGIDDLGADNALSIMNKISREQKRNTFLISHKSTFIGKVDNNLVVHLEDGFSRIETDGDIEGY
jgi:DNA repair exonuclease SbcCD ATPase subunit